MMNPVSPFGEENQDDSVNLSLSMAQPQPQPQPPLQPQPQPQPLASPMPPFSLFQQSLQDTFCLSSPHSSTPPSSSQVNDNPDTNLIPSCDLSLSNEENHGENSSRQQGRRRKLPVKVKRKGKSTTITPPFPWATSKRAKVYTLRYLLAHDMKTISGTVKCKKCCKQYDIDFDLKIKFEEVSQFIIKEKHTLHDRAPEAWMSPMLPTCKHCGQENSMKPLITKKKKINWLFLFLGQMIGCCRLSHLKYFCKHTLNHRTGAKDRLLYLTYVGLCKQLQPNGPFDA